MGPAPVTVIRSATYTACSLHLSHWLTQATSTCDLSAHAAYTYTAALVAIVKCFATAALHSVIEQLQTLVQPHIVLALSTGVYVSRTVPLT